MKSKKEIQKTLLRCNCQGLVTLDQEAANKGGGEAKVTERLWAGVLKRMLCPFIEMKNSMGKPVWE